MTKKPNIFPNKRRHPRYDVKTSAQFRGLGDPQWHAGNITNLSTGGFCLVTPETLEVGKLLEVSIIKPSKDLPDPGPMATVIWCIGDRYGMSFL